MKKKLEADLISIAHRILKMKNKSDIVSLHQEAQKLYEKLSVLRFVDEHFADARPTIGRAEIDQKLESGFDTSNEVEPVIENLSIEALADVEPTATDEQHEPEVETQSIQEIPLENDSAENDTEPEIPNNSNDEAVEIQDEAEAEEESDEIDEEEAAIEEEAAAIDHEAVVIEDEADANGEDSGDADPKEVFVPSFELSFEPKEDDSPKPATPQFSFDDLLGKDYADPVFVKREENIKTEDPVKSAMPAASEYTLPTAAAASESEPKNVSLNDRLSKGITIGLNDRIAFMKHLFNNSSEDYNRVLSQLITFDTYDEARTFIDEMVKPDYNDWNGKDEYSQRFMEIIEKRFI